MMRRYFRIKRSGKRKKRKEGK